MVGFSRYMFLLGSLLFIVGCSTKETSSSLVDKQVSLLSQFGASLEKVSSIDGKGSDTVFVESDSVSWGKELSFLSYLDQLNSSNYDIDTIGNEVEYRPREKGTIKYAKCIIKEGSYLYQLKLSKKTLISTSKEGIDIELKKYIEETPVIVSYRINTVKKSVFSEDFLNVKVSAKVKY